MRQNAADTRLNVVSVKKERKERILGWFWMSKNNKPASGTKLYQSKICVLVSLVRN